MKKLTDKRVLIRGYGSIARKYIKVLHGLGCTNIDVITSMNHLNNGNLSDSILNFKSVQDIQGEYDLLIIASETISHLSDFETLNKHAENILIEKPLATDLFSVTKILPKLKSKSLYVSSPLRFYDNFQNLELAISSLEQITEVQITASSWLPNWRTDRSHLIGYWSDPRQGGVLRDMVHEIDYALYLFGLPTDVLCNLESGENTLGIAVDAVADLFWTTKFGVKVSVHLDYISPISERSLKITGENRNLTWNILDGTLVSSDGRKVGSLPYFPIDPLLALKKQIQSIFSESRANCPSTLDEATNVLALIDAARLSNDLKRTASINYLT